MLFPISQKFLGFEMKYYPRLVSAKSVTTHTLRHTYASLLIAAGEDIVRVSSLLGHSNPNTTLGIYSHVIQANQYRSAERLVDVIRVSD